jgi:hypothetical protein
MNLRESIKTVLKEELSLRWIKRNFRYVNQWLNEFLDAEDVCDNWLSSQVDTFVDKTMLELSSALVVMVPIKGRENFISFRKKIYESLIESGYQKKIRDFFVESINNCDSLIKESDDSSISPQVKRRIPSIDSALNHFLRSKDPCLFKDWEFYAEIILDKIEDLVMKHFPRHEEEIFQYLKAYKVKEIKEYWEETRRNCL